MSESASEKVEVVVPPPVEMTSRKSSSASSADSVSSEDLIEPVEEVQEAAKEVEKATKGLGRGDAVRAVGGRATGRRRCRKSDWRPRRLRRTAQAVPRTPRPGR